MPFEPDDFFVGMIAYFRIRDLARAPRIRTTNRTLDAKPRPFICYAADAEAAAPGDAGDDEASRDAYWTCLTTTYKPYRDTLDRRWLRCPPGGGFATSLVTHDLIISHAGGSFAGPVSAFAACSRRCDDFPGLLRPVILPEGIAALKRLVRLRGGLLPQIARPPAVQHGGGFSDMMAAA